MKLEAAKPRRSPSSGASNSNSPTKSAADSKHIEEAIIAVIASSSTTTTSTCTVSLNNPQHQYTTSMSLGNLRSSNFADLPENLLETSTTPPAMIQTTSPGSYVVYATSSHGDTPVLTSLTPINVDLVSESSKNAAVVSYANLVAATSSSDSGNLTQLFPMAPNLNGSPLVSGVGTLPGYVAVKVEPQEVVIGGTVVSSGTVSALMSPSHLNLQGVTNVNSLNLANISPAADLFSMQPAAVYLQQAGNPNGQLQIYKVDFNSISSSSDQSKASVHKVTTAPSVSAVELANNLIATMLQQQQQQQQRNMVLDDYQADGGPIVGASETVVVSSSCESDDGTGVDVSGLGIEYIIESAREAGAKIGGAAMSGSKSGKKRPRSSSSGGGGGDGVMDEMDDIYIDTKELCSRIAYELKAHSIPQAVFAERVLCRSQGTLSDLLRNPKPWNKLKSGRETFRRMYQWLKQPLSQRMASLELWKVAAGVGTAKSQSPDSQMADDVNIDDALTDCLRRTPEQQTTSSLVAVHQSQVVPVGRVDEGHNDVQTSPRQEPHQRLVKKPRLVFTDIQKRTLQAIFKETQRPSREMQQTIAEHLGLDLSTVQNFFMNARRRSRIDQPQPDSPAPYQQVRPITPPPASPKTGTMSTDVGSSSAYVQLVSSTTNKAPNRRLSRVNKKNNAVTSVDDDNGITTTSGGGGVSQLHSGNVERRGTVGIAALYDIGKKIQLKIESGDPKAAAKPTNSLKTVLIEATIGDVGKT